MKDLISHYHKLKKNKSKIVVNTSNLKKNDKTEMSYLLRLTKIINQLEDLFKKAGVDYSKPLEAENLF